MEAFLQESIGESLNSYLYKNATFLAERLTASFPSEENVHLLATCYMRSRQTYRAYAALKGACHVPQLHLRRSRNKGRESDECRYLFAVAAIELRKLDEVERALTLVPGKVLRVALTLGAFLPVSPQVAGGAAGSCLLGTFCVKANRRAEATAHFVSALTSDPFCWTAFEELCTLGEEARATAILRDAKCVLAAAPVVYRCLSLKISRCSPSLLYPSVGVEAAPDEAVLTTPVALPSLLSPRPTRCVCALPHSRPAAERCSRSSAVVADVEMAASDMVTPASAAYVTPAPRLADSLVGAMTAAMPRGGASLPQTVASARLGECQPRQLRHEQQHF
jgi:anaphase-promoting complex subunit 3